MMVTGEKHHESHYQVLVFERSNKEVTVIEYSKSNLLDEEQINYIKEIIASFGWGHKK